MKKGMKQAVCLLLAVVFISALPVLADDAPEGISSAAETESGEECSGFGTGEESSGEENAESGPEEADSGEENAEPKRMYGSRSRSGRGRNGSLF